MKGALIELLARGKQDNLFISSNPDISQFRNVYKKYNNYTRFEAEQTSYGAAGFGKKVIYEIEKKGDLLTKCMLQIKLPATGDNLTSWINSIGIFMIKDVKLRIGGIIIDEYKPEYLDIYYKYNISLSEYSTYSEMISRIYGYKKNSNTQANILFVPLPFWFNKSLGDALPLINLGYMDIKIEVEFKTLAECLFNDTTSIGITGLEIQECRLYTELLYLPKDERCLFLNTKEFDYLIEQKQMKTYAIEANMSNKILHFNFNHPVKEILWVYRDNYHKNRNEWNIYTTRVGVNEEDPMVEAELLLNGVDRITKRPSGYFRLVEPFRHHKSAPADYVYFYSFAERPDEHQPNGYINMSLIDDTQLNLTMNSNIGSGELFLYAINYNHLKIKNGMAGILFQ